MKLHEKAKELGVKSVDLIKHLSDLGNEIKSPNQILSDEQLKQVESFKSSSEPINLSIKPEMAIMVTKSHEVIVFEVVINDERQEVMKILEKKPFPNKHQAYAFVEYTIGMMEMGVLNYQ